MKTKRQRLADRIRAAVAARKPTPKNWFDRLDDESRAELQAIKNDWKAGVIDSSGQQLAKDIVEQCRLEGITTCNVYGMRAWLSRD